MDTLAHPPVIAPDPLPGRVRIFRAAVDEEAARRGLPPEPWAHAEWLPSLWRCSGCGTANSSFMQWCCVCGKHR